MGDMLGCLCKVGLCNSCGPLQLLLAKCKSYVEIPRSFGNEAPDHASKKAAASSDPSAIARGGLGHKVIIQKYNDMMSFA